MTVVLGRWRMQGVGECAQRGEMWKWASLGSTGFNRFRALTLRALQASAVAWAVPSVLSTLCCPPPPHAV